MACDDLVLEEINTEFTNMQTLCWLEMFGDGDRTRRRPDDNDQSRGSTREEDFKRQVAEAAGVIEAFEAKLNEQVKAGELSKADFDKKLLKYSNEVFAKIKR